MESESDFDSSGDETEESAEEGEGGEGDEEESEGVGEGDEEGGEEESKEALLPIVPAGCDTSFVEVPVASTTDGEFFQLCEQEKETDASVITLACKGNATGSALTNALDQAFFKVVSHSHKKQTLYHHGEIPKLREALTFGFAQFLAKYPKCKKKLTAAKRNTIIKHMAFLPRSVKQAASLHTIASSFEDVGFPLKTGLRKIVARCDKWMGMSVAVQQAAFAQLPKLAALTWYLGRFEESDVFFLPGDNSGKLRNNMAFLPHNRACVFSTHHLRKHRESIGDAKEEKKERTDRKKQEREEKKKKDEEEKKAREEKKQEKKRKDEEEKKERAEKKAQEKKEREAKQQEKKRKDEEKKQEKKKNGEEEKKRRAEKKGQEKKDKKRKREEKDRIQQMVDDGIYCYCWEDGQECKGELVECENDQCPARNWVCKKRALKCAGGITWSQIKTSDPYYCERCAQSRSDCNFDSNSTGAA